MFEDLLVKEPVNTGRQKEIDVVKAFTILMMIVCHCIEEIYASYQGDILATVIREYENQIFGAQAFMICMGIGIVYSRRSTPQTHIARGFSLFIVGQVMNLARYAVPNLIGYAVTGDVFYRKTVFLVFSSDIMQFAGLTFLLIGILQKLKFSELKMFVVSILMNLVGMLLAQKVDTGNYVINQFLGWFISNQAESYFPFLHWFIYPAFGMVFGTILKCVKDKNQFYKTLLIPTGIFTIIYIFVAARIDQPFFLVIQNLESFNSMGITDALAQLVCNVCFICIGFYVSNILPEGIYKGVSFISGNINRFYCVQWVLIAFVDAALSLLSIEVTQALALYAIALALIVLTWFIVLYYSTHLAKGWAEAIGKNKALWYGLVVAASVIACVWAYGAGLPMPNMWNEYLE